MTIIPPIVTIRKNRSALWFLGDTPESLVSQTKYKVSKSSMVSGPSKATSKVGVYSLENRRLPKVVVASHLCRDEGKMGVNCL